MTDRELLQQALDALETLIVYSWNDGKKGEPDKSEDYAGVKIVEAIKARLAQPEPRVTEDMWKKLSELQQKVMEIAHTAPPKKEWVGLTDADWIIGKRSADYIAGAEWAEAKLKEKNS